MFFSGVGRRLSSGSAVCVSGLNAPLRKARGSFLAGKDSVQVARATPNLGSLRRIDKRRYLALAIRKTKALICSDLIYPSMPCAPSRLPRVT
ncbi:hypothetical protein C4K40_4272 [Pseudomonas sp. CMR5c]|nr:hypothetical protein C4K40_4272 [Pseudomonas sp. CMR5c]